MIIGLMPANSTMPNWVGDTLSLLHKGLSVFPSDVWVAILSNITFWASVQFSWAIIEWVYKKIPGVD